MKIDKNSFCIQSITSAEFKKMVAERIAEKLNTFADSGASTIHFPVFVKSYSENEIKHFLLDNKSYHTNEPLFLFDYDSLSLPHDIVEQAKTTSICFLTDKNKYALFVD